MGTLATVSLLGGLEGSFGAFVAAQKQYHGELLSRAPQSMPKISGVNDFQSRCSRLRSGNVAKNHDLNSERS